MSISINKDKCKMCTKCLNVCPGDLIGRGEDNKAEINYPSKCWGCTACMKECPYEAIELAIGKDVGGNGTKITANDQKEAIEWKIIHIDGKEETIKTLKHESNQY